MTRRYRLSTTRHNLNRIKYTVQWTSKFWATILYICVHSNEKILVWNSMKWFLKVQVLSFYRKIQSPLFKKYIQGWHIIFASVKPRTLMWDSYKIAISNIHATLNLYFNFEVIWGRNSPRKLKITDFVISMLTKWLRNEATKANLKHWMWQMWHYST